MHNSHNGTASSLDLPRLAKVCELLTSPHAGERAAAAEKATAMLVAADRTWTDLILRERVTSSGKSALEAHHSNNTTAYSKSSAKHGVYAAAIVSELHGKLDYLTEWEKGFIRDLHRDGNAVTLSDRQWTIVFRIARKTGVIVGAPA